MRPVERQGDAATCGHANTGSSDVFVNDRGATRVGLDSAGGTITGPGAPRVLVNGAPFSLQGDSIAPHGPAPHQGPKTSNPSQDVFVCLGAAASPQPSPQQPTPQQPTPQQPTPQRPPQQPAPQRPGSNDPNALLGQLESPGLLEGGVTESQRRARQRLDLARDWKDRAEELSAWYKRTYGQDLPPAVILGLMSRESIFGTILRSRDGVPGWGSIAWGVIQVNPEAHQLRGYPDPFSDAHLQHGLSILHEYRSQIRRRHPSWTEAEVLAGALVEYNSGPGNARTRPSSPTGYRGLDDGTDDDDYSADIWAQSQEFARQLWP